MLTPAFDVSTQRTKIVSLTMNQIVQVKGREHYSLAVGQVIDFSFVDDIPKIISKRPLDCLYENQILRFRVVGVLLKIEIYF